MLSSLLVVLNIFHFPVASMYASVCLCVGFAQFLRLFPVLVWRLAPRVVFCLPSLGWRSGRPKKEKKDLEQPYGEEIGASVLLFWPVKALLFDPSENIMRLRKGVKEILEGKEKQRIQLHLHQRLLNNVTAHVSHIDTITSRRWSTKCTSYFTPYVESTSEHTSLHYKGLKIKWNQTFAYFFLESDPHPSLIWPRANRAAANLKYTLINERFSQSGFRELT